jgi:hypothetical protein
MEQGGDFWLASRYFPTVDKLAGAKCYLSNFYPIPSAITIFAAFL